MGPPPSRGPQGQSEKKNQDFPVRFPRNIRADLELALCYRPLPGTEDSALKRRGLPLSKSLQPGPHPLTPGRPTWTTMSRTKTPPQITTSCPPQDLDIPTFPKTVGQPLSFQVACTVCDLLETTSLCLNRQTPTEAPGETVPENRGSEAIGESGNRKSDTLLFTQEKVACALETVGV